MPGVAACACAASGSAALIASPRMTAMGLLFFIGMLPLLLCLPPFFVERAHTGYWNPQITLANSSKGGLAAGEPTRNAGSLAAPKLRNCNANLSPGVGQPRASVLNAARIP